MFIWCCMTDNYMGISKLHINPGLGGICWAKGTWRSRLRVQTCDKIAAIRVELFVSWFPWGERSGNPPPGCSIRPYPAPTIWVCLKIGPSKSRVKLYLLNSYCIFGRALPPCSSLQADGTDLQTPSGFRRETRGGTRGQGPSRSHNATSLRPPKTFKNYFIIWCNKIRSLFYLWIFLWAVMKNVSWSHCGVSLQFCL